jgi:hypothetical protein
MPSRIRERWRWRSDPKRVSVGEAPGSGELPDSEQDRGGDAAGGGGGWRAAIQRIADYGAAGLGTREGSLRRAQKRDAAGELCPESIDQQGANLVTNGEDVIEELPIAGPCGAGASRAAGGRTAEPAAGGVAKLGRSKRSTTC